MRKNDLRATSLFILLSDKRTIRLFIKIDRFKNKKIASSVK